MPLPRRRSNIWIKLWLLLAALFHKYVLNPNATWIARLLALMGAAFLAAFLLRMC
jgi:hypothetical protein